jgi:hypothetical protein
MIDIRYSPDEWISKEGLYFAQFESGLCVPLSQETPLEFQRAVILQYVSALSQRAEALAKGIDYYTASGFMPIQRFFHRTRLGQYNVIVAAEILGKSAVA